MDAAGTVSVWWLLLLWRNANATIFIAAMAVKNVVRAPCCVLDMVSATTVLSAYVAVITPEQTAAVRRPSVLVLARVPNVHAVKTSKANSVIAVFPPGTVLSAILSATQLLRAMVEASVVQTQGYVSAMRVGRVKGVATAMLTCTLCRR